MNETTYRLYEFDQSLYLDGERNPASAGGACHLFALKWITLMVHSKNVGSNYRRTQLIKYSKEVKMLYKAFADRWDYEGSEGADEGVAKMLAVKIDKVESPGSKFETVSKMVRKEHRTGFVYTFWFNAGGGHSIAFYRSGATFGGHVYAYDPNYGEYKMNKSKMAAWVMNFLIPRYWGMFGAINNHQLRYVSAYTAPMVKGGVKVM